MYRYLAQAGMLFIFSFPSLMGMDVAHFRDPKDRSCDVTLSFSERAEALIGLTSRVDMNLLEKRQEYREIMRTCWVSIEKPAEWRLRLTEVERNRVNAEAGTLNALFMDAQILFFKGIFLPLLESQTLEDWEQRSEILGDQTLLAKEGCLSQRELWMSHPAIRSAVIPEKRNPEKIAECRNKVNESSEVDRAPYAWDYYWHFFKEGLSGKSLLEELGGAQKVVAFEDCAYYERYFQYRFCILNFMLGSQERFDAALALYQLETSHGRWIASVE